MSDVVETPVEPQPDPNAVNVTINGVPHEIGRAHV